MLQYSASPRMGHLEAVYHIFLYLSKHQKLRIVFNDTDPCIDTSAFAGNRVLFLILSVFATTLLVSIEGIQLVWLLWWCHRRATTKSTRATWAMRSNFMLCWCQSCRKCDYTTFSYHYFNLCPKRTNSVVFEKAEHCGGKHWLAMSQVKRYSLCSSSFQCSLWKQCANDLVCYQPISLTVRWRFNWWWTKTVAGQILNG
jgi:hypothetical protein